LATRYLVTGGAGLLGINLCRYLLARGHSVRSLDVAPFRYPERSVIDVIEADICSRSKIERALTNVDVVVHCAAAQPLASRSEIIRTGVTGTSIVLDRALAHHVKRFIFVSSAAVYGIPDHHPVLETDRLHGVGPYGESKIAAEQLCLRARAAGLCTPILRPKSFVGPGRFGAFELLYDWANSGRGLPVLGRGENRYQLLDVDDLCQAIELCATGDRERVNNTFNVGAREFGTMRESFQAVLDRAGHGRHVTTLPARPTIAVLKLLEALRLSLLDRRIYETAAQDSFVAIERIENQLGYRARYSNRDALLRGYDWYVAQRQASQSVTGVTHRAPREQGMLRFAKNFF
jgi:nucleoside-diphosphate-sugar epimerase